jgi:hypothetical protein
MVCLTKPFDKETNLDKDFNMIVTINNKTIAQNLTVKMKQVNKDATQVIPPSASPVLKTMITIQIETAFPFAVNDTSEWTVNLTLLELGSGVSPYYS